MSSIQKERDAQVAKGGGSRSRRAPRRLMFASTSALLVTASIALYELLSPSEHHPIHAVSPRAAPSDWTSSVGLVGVYVALVATFVGVAVVRGRRVGRRLTLARRAAALGDPKARAELLALSHSGASVLAAQAELELARIALADAAFDAALAHATTGLVRAQQVRIATNELVLPSLLGEIAVAKAAAGRTEEAEAELAMLSRDHPGFALLPSVTLRVRLVAAARSRDLARAADVARTRTASLPIPPREDALADLVLARAGLVGSEERERIEAELRADAQLATWVDAVAPGLRAPPRVAAAEPVVMADAAVAEDLEEPLEVDVRRGQLAR